MLVSVGGDASGRAEQRGYREIVIVVIFSVSLGRVESRWVASGVRFWWGVGLLFDSLIVRS